MTDLLAAIKTGTHLDQLDYAPPVVRATRPPATWTLHNCRSTHTDTQALARCIWPRAAWITGTGPWAVIAHCAPVTVSLHTDRATADRAILDLDVHGCGHTCTNDHQLAKLAATPAQQPTGPEQHH